MRAWGLAILATLALHALILLFGGIFFMKPEDKAETKVEEVDLLAPADKEPEEAESQEQAASQALKVEEQAPPKLAEDVEPAPQVDSTDMVARLDALSLGALEGALDPGASGDAFGATASLTSGGRVGGTGVPGLAEGSGFASDAVFDIGALDQVPRLVHQVPPVYPQDLRRRRIEGTVYVEFIVDETGRVLQPSAEASPHQELQASALEAVRRWRFEPAVIRGEKVRSKMRIPIRFSMEQ